MVFYCLEILLLLYCFHNYGLLAQTDIVSLASETANILKDSDKNRNLSVYSKIMNGIDEIDKYTNNNGLTLEKLLVKTMRSFISIDLKMFIKYINRINKTYNILHNNLLRKAKPNAGQVLSMLGNSSISKDIKGFNNCIVKSDIIKEMVEYFDNDNTGEKLCISKLSPHQFFYNLYTSAILTEIKTNVIVQFIRTFSNTKKYEDYNFYHDFEKITIMLKSIMQSTSSELWTCDAKNPTEGETFERFTRFLQGIIVNEQDIDKHGECMGSCSDYQYMSDAKKKICPPMKPHCKRQIEIPCMKNKLMNCIVKTPHITFCPGKDDRRYGFVDFQKPSPRDDNNQCSSSAIGVSEYSWKSLWTCSFCMCLCEIGKNSHRHVNLQTAKSDIDGNMVVTGLRFVKKDNVMYLQIQDGKLLPKAHIDPRSVSWKKIDKYSLANERIYGHQDYIAFDWRTRSVDLQDISVKAGSLVTGVRFKMIGTHLSLEVYSTPFNYDTGFLDKSKSEYIDDTTDENDRDEIHLHQPDIPIRSKSPSEIRRNSKRLEFIKFTHSDIDLDAAQTVVPFFDSQVVHSLRPVPLIGVGIYYKGLKGFGGFVAPKIITYKHGEHIP